MAPAQRPKNLQGSGAAAKTGGNKSSTCASRIEAATVHRTQVSMTENMVQDAEALFAAHDSEGTQLLSRGALTELLRQVGLEAIMGNAFGATARLAFDAHSADSHFLSLAEFKQLYYVVNQRYPGLLPRKPFLNIRVLSASGLPPADFNGKSDPFVVMQISGKPQSKSQTTIQEKTLEPVWGKPGVGEEFYDKYVYEEGDSLEFIVQDYDKGTTDYEVLGRGKLSGSEFHKPGGFAGDVQLKCPPDAPKGYNPTLRVKVLVNEVEQEYAANLAASFNSSNSGTLGKQRFKAAVAATRNSLQQQAADITTDEHAAAQHVTIGGEGVAPAGA
jgi:hypothetical protein